MTSFRYELPDLALDPRYGCDTLYTPGGTFVTGGTILNVETDEGVQGEVPGAIDEKTARYLLGRDPLQREIVWHRPEEVETIPGCDAARERRCGALGHRR